MNGQLSLKSTIFFLNLRRYLMDQHVSINELFNSKFYLSNPNEINQAQLVKLINLSESKFSAM